MLYIILIRTVNSYCNISLTIFVQSYFSTMTQISTLSIKSEDSFIIEVCNLYWQYSLEDVKYVFSAKEISEMFNMTIPKIYGIASQNSELSFVCELCRKTIKTLKKRGDFKLENIFVNKKCLCFSCQDKFRLDKSTKNRNEMLSRLDIAIKNQSWKKLNYNELSTLIVLSNCKTRNEVFGKLFDGLSSESETSKEIWNNLNTLDSMGLVWIERTTDNKIIDFHTNSRLRDYLESEFSNIFLDNNSGKLQIKLNKTSLKTSINQPDYSGNFILKKEIIFNPNIKYSYGAWLNADGTIFLKIEPVNSLKNED